MWSHLLMHGNYVPYIFYDVMYILLVMHMHRKESQDFSYSAVYDLDSLSP